VIGVAVTLWTSIQKVSGLNFGQDMDYSGTEPYCGFSYSLQVN